ncbi:MAG: dolichyl-phosphate beta-glucosyltransferase [Patescibacteria group bacterium]|nr:dolichyl-phosphate beta-glucosyltransferase [Patescibacteria group bacterium]
MSNSSSSQHFLSLIVPAYKQEDTIIENIDSLVRVLNQIRYPSEIIVVLDGAMDNSYKKIATHLKKWKNFSCYAYTQNRGKAFAIRYGMEKAKGDYIMFIDAGFEIDPNGISMLMEHLEWYDADIIVGSKRHPASQVNYTLQRKFFSLGYYFLVKLLFGINVKDTQAGIKIFRRKVLEKILPRLLEKRFAGDLEMLVVARTLGFNRIFEAPIKLNYAFSTFTSAATWHSIYFILVDTLAIYYRAFITKYYSQPHTRFVLPKDSRKIRSH